MNLEDLRSAQTRERATDGLQDLRDSFYGDVADYIQELKDRRDAAATAADDPFGDPEVQELTDRIETAEQVAEAIYERRMGKLVKQASLAAAGMPDDEDGLTAEEQELYADLVDRIESNKAHVLDVISGDAESSGSGRTPAADSRSVAADGDAASTDDPGDTESSAAAAMASGLDDADGGGSADSGSTTDTPDDDSDEPLGGGEPGTGEDQPAAIAEDLARVKDEEDGTDDGPTPDGGVQSENATGGDQPGVDGDRVRVRVTDDVGEIFGVDERPYDLEAEDVVTLPEANAEPLVQKDAAEKLE
jgi:DNA replication factor GINS